MKRILFVELALLAATAACTVFVPGPAKVFAQQRQAALFGPTKFDGVYSVEVTTKDGSCTESHWTVAVTDGQIASVSPNNADISASGLIESDGVVSLTFRGGQGQVAHVGGSIKGRYGKGAWSSPSLLCGGVWRAKKEK